MPDVDDRTEQLLDNRNQAPQGDIGSDEITSIARKVLDDLEGFVVETGNWDDLEDECYEGSEQKPIGVSLEELQLILDTSIRRHNDQHARMDEAARDHAMRTSVRIYADHAAIAPAPLDLESLKKAHRLRRRDAKDTLATGPLEELRHILQSKREEFAREREKNRRGAERPRLNRASYKANKLNSFDLRMGGGGAHEDGFELPSASRASVASSSIRLSRTGVHNQGSEPSESIKRGKMSSSERVSIPQPERHAPTATAEKACLIMPSDLGPDEGLVPPRNDLPETQVQPRDFSSKEHRETYTSERLRPPASESSWSSSWRSSSVSSSNASSSSSRHSESHSISSYKSSKSQRSRRRDDLSSIERRRRIPNVNHSSPLIPESSSRQHEQLEWELDLSNFNI